MWLCVEGNDVPRIYIHDSLKLGVWIALVDYTKNKDVSSVDSLGKEGSSGCIPV